MPQNDKPITKLLTWLDHNLLTYLAGLLLVFIPLYPKIPLFDAIPGYIVRVRPEDFLILLTALVWIVQLARRRVKYHPLISKFILAYLVIGFLSTLSAIFLTKSVPLDQIHIVKLYFHYFRRFEYFSLFFIFYSAITNQKQVKTFILSLIPVTLLISIYGYGQKYLYWPVYSTMNREFAKGVKLYLTEHARVPSTFGGHYDAAAFIMIAITIILSIFFFAQNKILRLISLITYVAGFWLLILTASRTSFIAYLVSVTALMMISLLVKSWKWALPRWLAVMAFSMFIMLSFGDLSERFAQVIGLDKITSQLKQALLSAKVDKPKDGLDMTDVLVASDQQPEPQKPLPGDVYEDIPLEIKITTDSGEIKTQFVSRTFSDNAYKYGLSAAIRLDALWPRAIAGFKANPMLGSGYSTLTKEAVGVFTEAESTDNDFLRSLGETGILGFVAYYGTLLAIVIILITQLHRLTDPLYQAFILGFIAAVIGLLLNAIYIDVFEASKVAESFWALAGIALAIPFIPSPKPAPKAKQNAKASSK